MDYPQSGSIAVDVVVATYKRPDELRKCLQSLSVQEIPHGVTFRVLVGVRLGDEESRLIAEAWRATIIAKHATSLLPVLCACIESGHGSVIMFIDDDAEAEPSWIASHLAWYKDPSIGAVGGSELPGQGKARKDQVGRVTWFGRIIGNHDCVTTSPRFVSVLKGVNFSMRRDVYVRPPRLKGGGAELHWELWFCNVCRQLGMEVLFDPNIKVRHHLASRNAGAMRHSLSPADSYAFAYNATVVMLPFVGWARRMAMLMYGVLVGDWGAPGIARVMLGCLRGDWEIVTRLPASIIGRTSGIVAACTAKHRERQSIRP